MNCYTGDLVSRYVTPCFTHCKNDVEPLAGPDEVFSITQFVHIEMITRSIGIKNVQY